VKQRMLALGLAVALVGLWPVAAVHAQMTGLPAVDAVVHEWDEGKLSAEAAMKEIDAIIHAIPAAQRTGVLLQVDHVIHEWDDAKLTAEAAMKEIEELVHGHGGAHAPQAPAAATPAAATPAATAPATTAPASAAPAAAAAPAARAGSPAPAKTGNAGLGDTTPLSAPMAIGGVALLLAFMVSARRTTRSAR